MTDNDRMLIHIPKDGEYIEILGHRIDGFDSFQAFCEYLKKFAEMEETINRQKAEIERYEKIVGKLAINKDGIAIGTLNGKQTEYIQKSVAEVFRNMAVNRAKAEAVKEFAKRLKSKHRRILEYDEAGFSAKTAIVYVEDIDNLVKEFTEEQT